MGASCPSTSLCVVSGTNSNLDRDLDRSHGWLRRLGLPLRRRRALAGNRRTRSRRGSRRSRSRGSSLPTASLFVGVTEQDDVYGTPTRGARHHLRLELGADEHASPRRAPARASPARRRRSTSRSPTDAKTTRPSVSPSTPEPDRWFRGLARGWPRPEPLPRSTPTTCPTASPLRHRRQADGGHSSSHPNQPTTQGHGGASARLEARARCRRSSV